jgi:thiamine-phosphate pyrophosphorylase
LARTLVSKPLVAIGGITLQSVPEVIAAGADSIAVIGDLWTGAGGGSRRVSEFVRSLDDDSMR